MKTILITLQSTLGLSPEFENLFGFGLLGVIIISFLLIWLWVALILSPLFIWKWTRRTAKEINYLREEIHQLNSRR